MDCSENLDYLASIIDSPKGETKTKLDNAGRRIESSEIHGGDTDSSDDEDNRQISEPNYNELGQFAKANLKESISDSSSNLCQKPSTWRKLVKCEPSSSALSVHQGTSKTQDCNKIENYEDLYGIRVINPLISSQSLKEKMAYRQAIPLSKIKNHVNNPREITKDWVVAGVIVGKWSKTSQNGKPYCLWTISDLRPGLKTLSLFLFGKAYAKLWKTCIGSVVAILNPSVMDNKSTADAAALSVHNPDQIMMWGTSKDFGTCRAMKKNGDPCKAFVNTRECEYCIYHVQQEYKKLSRRSELQSSSGGSLQKLKNKLLGKQEVFYAGKSYTASRVPATKNRKAVESDKNRLMKLGGASTLSSLLPNIAVKTNILPARSQQIKDAERLRRLTGLPVTISSTVKNSLLSCEKFKKGETSGRKCTKSKTKQLQRKKENTNNLKIPFDHDQQDLGEEVSLKDKILAKDRSPSILNLSSDSNYSVKKSPTLKLDSITKSKTASTPLIEIINEQDFDNELNYKLQSAKKLQPSKNRFENLVRGFGDVKDNSLSRSVKTKPELVTLRSGQDSLIDLSLPIIQKQKLNPGNNPSIELSTSIIRKRKLSLGQNPSTKLPSSIIKKQKLNPGQNPSTDVPSSFIQKQKLNPGQNSSTELLPVTNKQLDSPLSVTKKPALGSGQTSLIDLSKPFSKSQAALAKINAIKLIRERGPIKKVDPNACNKKSPKIRRRKPVEEDKKFGDKEPSSVSERFVELMKVTSINEDLLHTADEEKLQEYFSRKEKEEKLEEKMLTTFTVDCKAVKCINCKYKWFSASELCKSEGHTLRVIDAVKRFFKCKNCSNRIVSLEFIPLHSCFKCGISNWERAPMLRDRKSVNLNQLSIRGGEQKFMNSVESNGNLNLLVPD